MKSEEEKATMLSFGILLAVTMAFYIGTNVHIDSHASETVRKIEVLSEVSTETLAKYEVCKEQR